MVNYSDEAWEEGYNAYWSDLNKEDNPYEEYSREFYEWEEGWESARDEVDDE